MDRKPVKTEAELIATVANIDDAEGALLFAERALKHGMVALAAAAEERAKILQSPKKNQLKAQRSIWHRRLV
jgi:hypothetical protein